MIQRKIINTIAPDFKRDNQSQQAFITQKKEAIIEFITNYVQASGADGIVTGISGGVDSFLVGALCAQALKNIGKKLRLVILPNNEQSDYQDATDSVQVIQTILPELVADTVSIGNAYRAALRQLEQAKEFSKDVYTLANLQPRIRMMYQYALGNGLLVAGTDNASEETMGFFTKYGDGGVDLNPIQELIKDDVFAMAELLDAPKAVLTKKPAAGLGISDDDETEMGIAYKHLNAYLRGEVVPKEAAEILESTYNRTMHKRAMPATMRQRDEQANNYTIVVVDFIRSFINGELACKYAPKAVQNTVKYINKFPGSRVLYVRDSHPPDHCSFTEQGGIWPVHAVKGSMGAAFPQTFYRDIEKTVHTPLAHYNVFDKGMDSQEEQYSGMQATNPQYGTLAQNLTKHVVVVGAATEYCIKQTTKDLLRAGHHVLLPESCLAYVDEKEHEQTLVQLGQLGADVLLQK